MLQQTPLNRYIPWNIHEPKSGQYDFSGQQDLVGFLKLAQQNGLDVILRAGPYICGEWDFGGIPSWMLKNNGSIVLRTMDPGYITPVNRWFSVLLPRIKPLLYSNGGPVIMVQVENEYGSYFACDHVYMDHLQGLFRSYLGDDILLFTTDGNGLNYLKCGTHPKLFATVDFGAGGNASAAFNNLRQFQPNGPLVNSEFYTGWLDYWGHPHAYVGTDAIVTSLKEMIDIKASVNMYMFEGGTNFGYTNGADPPFNICPTSYDYNAPMTEAGDTTEKYLAIRSLLMQYKNVTKPVPKNTTKGAYGQVSMKRLGSVLELADEHFFRDSIQSKYPMTMEELDQSGGFILYRTKLGRDYPGDTLNGQAIRDRAHIFVDGSLRGLIDRNLQTSMTLSAAKGQKLDLFIENQGHINFGTQINNGSKGIYGNITLGSDTLTGWTITYFNLTTLSTSGNYLKYRKFRNEDNSGVTGPAVFSGLFQLPSNIKSPQDTFLNVSGWFKGQAFVNDFNLGRYWPVRGPQLTLYVPGSELLPYPAYNKILLLELDHTPCNSHPNVLYDVDCVVSLVDKHDINGPYIPYKVNREKALKHADRLSWQRGRIV